MRKQIFITTLLASSLLSSSIFAQAPVKYSKYLERDPTIRKFYVGGGLDAFIFSTATIHHDANTPGVNGTSPQSINTLGTIRFTGFLNIGISANFNVSPHFGIYTGLDLKNVGYIEQNNGYTLKRRTYNVGAPLGFKFGNMARNKGYVFLGGGLDAPINYYEKYFHDRTNKTYTLNEWFSYRTPTLMPYVFLGASFSHGVTAKVQYYPNNFLSENYTDNNGNMPNQGTVVNLVLFSIGFNMYWHVEHNHDHSTTFSYGNEDNKNDWHK